MGLVPRSLYSQSQSLAFDGVELHPTAYCKSPSPLSSPVPRMGTAYKEAEDAYVAVPPTAQVYPNILGEKRGRLPARNQSEKCDMLSRSKQPHALLGEQRSTTAMTRQEFFRPAGYTSAAPWLRSDQSQQLFAWGDGRPYPYQPKRRSATTGSMYTEGAGDYIVLKLSRDGTIFLPNPYGHPPPGHNAEHSRAGTLSRPFDDGDISLPLAEHLRRNSPEPVQQQSLKARLGPQYGGHPHYTLAHPQDTLPEVAITESRLILGGVDVYADTTPIDMTANANGSGPNTYAKPHFLSSSTLASMPPLANGTQKQDRRICSERLTASPNSLYVHSHPPQLYPAVHFSKPVPSLLPLNFITTQPTPHPTPSASTLFSGSEPKPPFVRRDTPGGMLLHDSRSDSASNRNPKNIPVNADGTRDWSSDLCMFCDHNLGSCLAALVCPCIVYAQNKARLEHLNLTETPLKARPSQTRGDSKSDDCASRRSNWCSGWATKDCAVHGCLTVFCLFGWAMQVSAISYLSQAHLAVRPPRNRRNADRADENFKISNRAAIRKRYDIEGDLIGDCAAALCCSSCELAQASREIALEERSYYSA